MQERQNQEEAAAADGDSDEMIEGEGEEESPKEDDEVVDVENEHGGARAAPAIGNAFAEEMAPQQPKRRRKSGKTADPDLEADADVQETDSTAPDWLAEDKPLKSVVSKLGRFYRCFLNMSPEQNLTNRKPAGHQIRGVGDSVGETCQRVLHDFMLIFIASNLQVTSVSVS